MSIGPEWLYFEVKLIADALLWAWENPRVLISHGGPVIAAALLYLIAKITEKKEKKIRFNTTL